MTAVEYLETQIVKFHNWKRNPIYNENCFDEIELNKAIRQAKEMEKQQIIDTYITGSISLTSKIDAEQYYNETFKNK